MPARKGTKKIIEDTEASENSIFDAVKIPFTHLMLYDFFPIFIRRRARETTTIDIIEICELRNLRTLHVT